MLCGVCNVVEMSIDNTGFYRLKMQKNQVECLRTTCHLVSMISRMFMFIT